MTEDNNCGACGDPLGKKHECWVWNKIQTQENINPTCPICFEEVATPHWRCMEQMG